MYHNKIITRHVNLPLLFFSLLSNSPFYLTFLLKIRRINTPLLPILLPSLDLFPRLDDLRQCLAVIE